MSALVFNEDRHEYSLDGQRLPSVTQLLAPLVDYSKVPKDVLERAQQLGTAVHRMTELFDNDDLDEDSLSDELRPYLAGWIKFRAECQFEPERISERQPQSECVTICVFVTIGIRERVRLRQPERIGSRRDHVSGHGHAGQRGQWQRHARPTGGHGRG